MGSLAVLMQKLFKIPGRKSRQNSYPTEYKIFGTVMKVGYSITSSLLTQMLRRYQERF